MRMLGSSSTTKMRANEGHLFCLKPELKRGVRTSVGITPDPVLHGRAPISQPQYRLFRRENLAPDLFDS